MRIERPVLEAEMRRRFAEAPGDALDDAGKQCQHRGTEVAIQFFLWLNDEKNGGTPPQVLIDGATRLLGNCVENLANLIKSNRRDMVGDIMDRILWAATPEEQDTVLRAFDTKGTA